MAVRLADAGLDEEARRIREIVAAHLRQARQTGRLPTQVQTSFDVDYDEDSAGDLIFAVWLHVADGRLPSREDASRLAELTLAVQSELSGAGLRHWTNVSVRPGS